MPPAKKRTSQAPSSSPLVALLAELFGVKDAHRIASGIDPSHRKGEAVRVSFDLFPDGTSRNIRIGASSEPTVDDAGGDGLAAARQRGKLRAAEILSGVDMLSADELAGRLGTSRVTVNDKRKRGELLALEGISRGYKYPVWQLDEYDRPFEALRAIAERLGGNEWTLYRFLVQHHDELDGLTGVEALRLHRDADVIEAAESVARAFS
jgi:hypothetical protein